MAKPTRSRRAARPATRKRKPASATPVPPLDVLADIGTDLAIAGVSLENLQRFEPHAEQLLTDLSRGLAAKLMHLPVQERSAVRTAAMAGYLAAIGKGLQLGTIGLESWRRVALATVADAVEAGDIEPEAGDFLTGVLAHGKNVVCPTTLTQ